MRSARRSSLVSAGFMALLVTLPQARLLPGSPANLPGRFGYDPKTFDPGEGG